MSDIKYMVLRSYDPYMAELYGKKKSKLDKTINLRSYLTHSELEFSARYGGISASSTMRDGADGFRFKMIDYDKHKERWKNVYIPVTAEEEHIIWDKACRMAGIGHLCDFDEIKSRRCINECYYGLNHVKYDKLGVGLAFLTRARIWKGHKDDMWCSEAVAVLLQEVWQDLLMFGTNKPLPWKVGETVLYKSMLNPDDIQPSLLDSICRTKFDNYIERNE